MSDGVAADIDRAAAAIREVLRPRAPLLGAILGSGLGGLAGALRTSAALRVAEIPGFSAPTVAGHPGRLVCGEIGGRELLLFDGRFHLYEGLGEDMVALPVRVMHALGIATLLVANAAGGIRRSFHPGQLMLITDHLNLTGRNPLIGPLRRGELRFPDMSEPYDRALAAHMHAVARERGIALEDGVYAGVLGPSYETPAEIRMLDRFGADAVGMSTVPEVIAARALGMRVTGLSVITNPAAGLSSARLSHETVLEVTRRASADVTALIRCFLERLVPAADASVVRRSD